MVPCPLCRLQTDGMADGTTFVKAVESMGQPAVFDGKLFFAGDGELYSSDGTADGTAMFKEINAELNPKGGPLSSELVRVPARTPARAHRMPPLDALDHMMLTVLLIADC